VEKPKKVDVKELYLNFFDGKKKAGFDGKNNNLNEGGCTIASR
jgi:hypothetical protein